MPRALVVGGEGFRDSHLVDYLINDMKFDVVILNELSGCFEVNV